MKKGLPAFPAPVTFRLLELLNAAGVWKNIEIALIAALGQMDGQATAGKLCGHAGVCWHSGCMALYTMATDATRVRSLPFGGLITLENCGAAMTRLPFIAPKDMIVKLAVKGWEAAHLMGFRMPAVIRDDLQIMPPEIADGVDPEARLAELQAFHTFSRLVLTPAKSFSSAAEVEGEMPDLRNPA